MRPALTPPSRRALLAAVLATLPVAAQAQDLHDLATGAQEGMAPRFNGGARSTGWLPLEPGDNLILRARLNGAPVRLILDSGANVSLVDLRLAGRLGLRAQGARTVRDGAGLSSPGADLADVTIALPGLTLTGVRAVSVDLAGLADAGDGVPVVLGREAFERLGVDIDGPARRIAFHAPGAFAPPADARSLPLEPAGKGQRQIPLTVEGAPGLAAQFDLGSQSALVAQEAFAQAHGWLSGRPTSTWIAQTVAGVRPERTATVRGVALAGFTLPPVPLETVASWEAPDLPLIVGLPLLSRFRLVTDYASDRLWLQPRDAALAAPFRKDRSGLACKPAGAALEVAHVAERSPAAEGGWRVGDLITTVDGRPAATQRGFGAAQAGRRYALALATGETWSLTLADYF